MNHHWVFKDEEVVIEPPFFIYKQEKPHLPFLKILNKKEKFREFCKVIYDTYFDDDNVDLSQVT